MDEQVYSCFLVQRPLRYFIEIKILREDFYMKFLKMAMGLFILFLLSNTSMQASIVSDVGHAIDHVVCHPIDSAVKLAKVVAKGFVAYTAGRLAWRYGCQSYDQLDSEITLGELKKPFEALLICVGVGMISCKCVKSLMGDVKTLK